MLPPRPLASLPKGLQGGQFLICAATFRGQRYKAIRSQSANCGRGHPSDPTRVREAASSVMDAVDHRTHVNLA